MKRTLLVVFGMALCASAASAQNFDCRKAKADPKFGGTTANISSALGGVQTGAELKKPFLHCGQASVNGGPTGTLEQVCYKVKGTKGADGSVSTTDAFGNLMLTVKGKTFVLCVPAT